MKWIGKLKVALGADGKGHGHVRQGGEAIPDDDRLTCLTPREREVFALLIQGKKRREAAALLSVTEATVGFHTQSLYRKLDIHDRAQLLLRYAIPGMAGPDTKIDEGDMV